MRYRQTWGVVLAKAILDPYWFLVADWFALFLVSRGFKLEDTLVGFWVPFVCADVGNFAGGGLSGYFIHRGWSVGASRRIIFLIFGPLMLLMIPAAYTTRLWLLIAEFGLATLGYAACATIFLTLPSDLFESGSVATVSGLAGMVTGFVTIAATYAIGAVTDKYSFAPILLAASAAPVLAADRRVRAGAEHAGDGERRAAEDLSTASARGEGRTYPSNSAIFFTRSTPRLSTSGLMASIAASRSLCPLAERARFGADRMPSTAFGFRPRVPFLGTPSLLYLLFAAEKCVLLISRP